MLLVFSLLVQAAIGYYFEVTWVLRHDGQTIGKRVLSLRTVGVDGTALTRAAAHRRYGVQFVATVVPLLAYLDGLWQLWDKPLRQCLHDKAARTVVVKV